MRIMLALLLPPHLWPSFQKHQAAEISRAACAAPPS
jgi:hypothetical protein